MSDPNNSPTRPSATPCGEWTSPLSADLVVEGKVSLSGVRVRGEEVFWVERRPEDGGRCVIVRRDAQGEASDVTPTGMNTRTRVHEYGGGAFGLLDEDLVLANFSDQCWYRVTPGSDAEPRQISDRGYRHADADFDRVRGRLVCVQEDHMDDFEPKNRIVSIDLEGGGPPITLAEGNDFYASPRVSPDGSRLSYVTWNHPDMPWDQAELWVQHFESLGYPGIRERIAGGEGVSASSPEWTAEGALHFVDDRTGYWNHYRHERGETIALCERPHDFAGPAWTFGQSPFAVIDDKRLVATWIEGGRWRMGLLDQGELSPFELPFTDFQQVRYQHPGRVVCLAGAPDRLDAVVRIDLETQAVEVLRSAGALDLPPELFSHPRPIEFPTTLPAPPERRPTSSSGEWTLPAKGKGPARVAGDEPRAATETSAHALYYAPCNPAHSVPEGEQPPLLVLSHGGPTSMASTRLDLRIQYWTSRGFAVVDVNYGGSSGYGRAYRERLRDRWGLVDVEDCVRAANYLTEQKLADPARLAIRGGSAGGYTTLCALTFRDVFKAGASHYGVSDLEALARDTHKFESHYLHGLIGPWPDRSDLYRERSPIHSVERLSCPVILFQGLEDKVVPPNQAERMVEALRKKGIPVAYVAFEGEQHGFRKAENIRTTLEGELYFYGRVFGFQPQGELEAVLIENLD